MGNSKSGIYLFLRLELPLRLNQMKRVNILGTLLLKLNSMGSPQHFQQLKLITGLYTMGINLTGLNLREL